MLLLFFWEVQVTYVEIGKLGLPLSFAIGGDSDTSAVV
jgi:hypothetical protein